MSANPSQLEIQQGISPGFSSFFEFDFLRLLEGILTLRCTRSVRRLMLQCGRLVQMNITSILTRFAYTLEDTLNQAVETTEGDF